MSDPCDDKSTTGRALARKIKRGAKFNFDFCEVASRLKAAGMSDSDLAYVLAVKPCTIKKWKQRYSEFSKSCKDGKETAVKFLVANGLRAAMGYDFEEIEQEVEFKEDGTEVIKKEKRRLKHQTPNTTLLIFFLLNLSEEYHNTKQVEVNQTTRNLDLKITGELESDQIKKLAGAAISKANQMERQIKQVESDIIDAEPE